MVILEQDVKSTPTEQNPVTSKENDCPFCDFGSVYEYKSTEHFQYGCDDDAVMLWTNVVVLACSRCSQKWTDYRSEDSRQAAVEKHLATGGVPCLKFGKTSYECGNEKCNKIIHEVICSECGFDNGKLEIRAGGISQMKTFILADTELEAYELWRTEHNKTCPYYDDGTKAVSPQGAIGGRITFRFTPTGIGTAVGVECACGTKQNLTDYSNW